MKLDSETLNYPWSYIGSGHTLGFINPKSLKVYIKRAVKCMKTIKAPYDTLAFAGISGAIIGPLLAMKLGKECLLVHKDGDRRHTSHEVSGYDKTKSYLIVDDLVDSGDTVRMIQKKIYEFNQDARCLGVVSVQELEPNAKDDMVYSTYQNLSKDKLTK